jgi:hypothetical protein
MHRRWNFRALSRIRNLVMWTGVWLMTLTAPVFAASGGGQQIGQNLGHLLSSWAKSLYLGIAAIISIMFLLNRRFTELAVFVLAAVIVGGFVLSPTAVENAVTDIWQTVTG